MSRSSYEVELVSLLLALCWTNRLFLFPTWRSSGRSDWWSRSQFRVFIAFSQVILLVNLLLQRYSIYNIKIKNAIFQFYSEHFMSVHLWSSVNLTSLRVFVVVLWLWRMFDRNGNHSNTHLEGIASLTQRPTIPSSLTCVEFYSSFK